MTRTPYAYGINPELLRRSREKCGFSKALISKRIHKSVEELEEIERGERKITMAQLRTLANSYKRPTSFFYLYEIPREFDLPDFKTRK